MAKVQNTLIGRASGSVGGATFTTWKGINVLKSKAENVANPRTLGQISQRNRLSVIVAIYRLLALFISVGFKSRAIAKSAYNAFTSSNIITATSVNGLGVAVIDYAALKLSLGTIGSTAIDGQTANAGGNAVVIEYDGAADPVGSNADDIAYAAVFNATKNEWGTNFGDERQDNEIGVVMASNLTAGDVLHMYLFFKSATDANTSDSVYATVVV